MKIKQTSSLRSANRQAACLRAGHQTGAPGFTLLEMILAIGIAALVLLVVSSVLFSALNLREATVATVDAAAPVDSAVNYLKRDLQNCVAPTNGSTAILGGAFRVGSIVSAGGNQPVLIEMNTTTGAVGDDAPWGDVQRVTYELKAPLNVGLPGRDLYRSITRNLLSVATPTVDDQLLLSGVDNIRFACYDGAQWNNTWDTTMPGTTDTNLPVAVRVDIQMAGNMNAAPVEFVVPIITIARTNMVPATMTGTTGT